MNDMIENLIQEGWEEMPIESQASTKEGNNSVLRKIRMIEGASYNYKYLVKCDDCGHEFIVTRLTRGGKCPNCKKLETVNQYVGQTVNNYKILAFDHFNKTTAYFKVKCIQCGEESILSRNSIFHPVKASGCKKCWYSTKVGKEETPKHTYYLMYKRKAEERKLEFNLSEEEFSNLINKPCAYCGENPTPGEYMNKNFNKSGILFFYNGVDRIDSNKGYYIDNCVPCCTMCNRMKLNYSKYDFLNKIRKIHSFLKLDEGLTTSCNNVAPSGGEMGDTLTSNVEGNEIV